MNKFQEMQAFVAVVDAGSFVRAAEALDTSKAAVSRHVAELEERLGVRLLNRTTRKLSLTDEGQKFYLRCTELIDSLEEAESELHSRTGQANGLLRVSAPLSFGIIYLAPLWGQFLRANPKVTLDVALSDRAIDLVEEGLDLAIRVASMPHPALIARQLASTRLVLCASPEYLALHGTPVHPRELLDHEVISYVNNSSSPEWRFEGPDGPVTIKTRPRLLANNGDTCRAAALEHQGIILQPDFLLHEDLRLGRLIELMPQWRGPDMQVYAVYASRRQLSVKLRHMVDFLAQAFRAPPWQAARQE